MDSKYDFNQNISKGNVEKEMDTSRNALRERTRVKSLRIAFQRLQSCLPTVPPNTKLSKLDILILATNYISYLGSALTQPQINSKDLSHFKLLHPIKKWPMRCQLYASFNSLSSNTWSNQNCLSQHLINNYNDHQQFFNQINTWDSISSDFWTNDAH